MRAITVCDLIKAIIQSSRPTDQAQAIRDKPNIKSLWQKDTERNTGGKMERRQAEDKWDTLRERRRKEATDG